MLNVVSRIDSTCKPYLYRGEDCMKQFVEQLTEIKKDIFEKTNVNKPMDELTNEQKLEFKLSSHCSICGKKFEPDDEKVRDHRPAPPQPSDVTSVVHVTQVNMNVNIPTPSQPSDVTSVVHVTQVNMNVNMPTPPQPSDVTSVVHVTQVNMNVNIPTPPQPSDVTSVVHVTQVNMNVNIPTPPQPSDVTSVVHASISRATCLQSAKMPKTQGSLMAP